MTNTIGTNGLDGADATTSNGGGSAESWFEALAKAWGSALDAEAQKISDMSGQISAGSEDPSQVALLTAESQRMAFMANSEATSVSSVGDALQTMARKQ